MDSHLPQLKQRCGARPVRMDGAGDGAGSAAPCNARHVGTLKHKLSLSQRVLCMEERVSRPATRPRVRHVLNARYVKRC